MNKLNPSQFLLLLVVSFLTRTLSAQVKQKTANIVVNRDDETVKTQMLNQKSSFVASSDRTYFWFGTQKLMETTGGYDGRLIHGTYASFYLNNQLKEKGHFRYGLRNKEWKYWYPDGKLKEVITWKNGVKNGRYELYNDAGQKMATGCFKNNKLNGTFITYLPAGNILEKKKFKNGEEVVTPIRDKTNTRRIKKERHATDSTGKSSFFKFNFLHKKKKKNEKPAAAQDEKKKSITS
jgi:hypothetical protein